MTSEVTQADRVLVKELRFHLLKDQEKIVARHRIAAEQAAAKRERDLVEAARGLIADVRRRYPGEDLRCPYSSRAQAIRTLKD